MTKPPTREDLQFLRDIRGRFQDSKSNQTGQKVLCFLFFVVFPALFLLAFFFWPEPGRWWFAVFALGSLGTTVVVWKELGVEYEFTGDEIIERRAGRIRHRIQISDVIEAQVKISPQRFIVKTNNFKMVVRIFPSLNEVIQKKGAELLSKQSGSERQRYEEVKQQMSSRVKWVKIIGAIASVIVAILAALAIRWFTTKH